MIPFNVGTEIFQAKPVVYNDECMTIKVERNFRVKHFRKYLHQEEIDVAIIQDMADMYWLTGFNTAGSPQGQSLIVTHNDTFVCTRVLETTNAHFLVSLQNSIGYDEGDDPIQHIVDQVLKLSPKVVAVQTGNERMTASDGIKLFSTLAAKCNLVCINGVIRNMRSPKSNNELAFLRRAGELCASAMTAAIKSASEPHATEDTVAAAADYANRTGGGDYLAYPQFVAYGKNISRGHYAANGRNVRILPGKTLFCELAGCHQRYHAAMMRTFFIGDFLPAELELASKCVAAALTAMKGALLPGVSSQEIDRAAYTALAPLLQHGWIICQRKGYSIGCAFFTDWGEAAEINITPKVNKTIPLNATLHLIPWIRHPVFGGVGLSDTVVVKESGAESLLGSKKPAEEITLIKPNNPHKQEALKVREFFQGTITEPTPLRLIEPDSPVELGCTVLVKDEGNRLGQKSFKAIGGAYTLAQKLAQLSSDKTKKNFADFVRKQDEKQEVFATASDGNHGAGLAWTAQQLGHKAVIWFPNNVSQSRIDTAKSFGAEVRVSPFPYDETVRLAAQTAEAEGWHLIQDTAWEGYTEVPYNIMSGYKLIAHEAVEQVQEMKIKPTHVIVQVGVGSFASAIVDYMRESIHHGVSIITIEPKGSACLYKSLKAGVKTDLDEESPDTISVGLDCGVVSDLAWPVLRDNVDVAVTFADEVAADGARAAAAVGIKAGESGASPGLGFLRNIWNDQKKRRRLGLTEDSVVLMFNTESLTNPELNAELLSEPLAPLSSLEASRESVSIYILPHDRSLHFHDAPVEEECSRSRSSSNFSAYKSETDASSSPMTSPETSPGTSPDGTPQITPILPQFSGLALPPISC